MKIIKKNNVIYFINENQILVFYQKGSGDLSFYIQHTKELKKEYEFIIKENNDAYKIFQKFYDKVIKEVKEKPINYLYHSDLIQNNKLHFESDAPNDLFTYNYLDIEKRDSEISLKVIDNTNECFTNFEINTDRSKYYTLRFFFIDLLNELKTIKTNEYVYTKRR